MDVYAIRFISREKSDIILYLYKNDLLQVMYNFDKS